MGLIEVEMDDGPASAVEVADERALTDYYVNALLTAEEQERDEVAIPVVTAGFPVERAAEIAAMTIRSLAIIDRIRLVAFDEETCLALRTHLAAPVEESCPRCGARAVPIAYGPWNARNMAARDAGLVALGGCFVMDDGTDAQWECTADGEHRWTNGERDERRHQVAVLDVLDVAFGEDRGRSVP
ncbi:hypothetical protein [Lentzea flava]|uniref:Uncharacterized protein n=1 Tax=Lentzea flava TaxID=103732 RepID=A0ABQ2UF97_9PSEU|nr:hypothetical protein [Lentzea flava]MCP2198624.1 hypothetical protein [Lentzea flava]GGU28951.1 hypothetical protein GCM10010178_21330 [Lentzea flava]